MKNKILKLINEKNEIYLLDLLEIMPEIKGDAAMYMPVKAGYNPNVLWVDYISKEFIELFNQLVFKDKILDIKSIEFWELLIDGKPYYPNIPWISKRMAKGKKTCWMPISLIKGENFSFP